jgi:hypothetical protein
MLIVILLTRKDKNHECSLLLIRGRVLDRGAIKTHLSREIVGPRCDGSTSTPRSAHHREENSTLLESKMKK